MTLQFDGQVLPTRFGFPLRIRIPTKLGFKNPKHVVGLSVVNHYPGATGRTAATTGSAGCDSPLPASGGEG